MTTGERIKKLRIDAGILQSDLAKTIGCSSQVISNIERGYTSLNMELLLSLAQFFHVSADYLLGREERFGQKLTDEEEFLIDYYQNASVKDRRILMSLIHELAAADQEG